jgi:hypothetical protein
MITMSEPLEKHEFMRKLERKLGYPNNHRKVLVALQFALQTFSEVFCEDDVQLVQAELQIPEPLMSCACNGCPYLEGRTGQCTLPDDSDIRLAMGCLLELYVTVTHREMKRATATLRPNQPVQPILNGQVPYASGYGRLHPTRFASN